MYLHVKNGIDSTFFKDNATDSRTGISSSISTYSMVLSLQKIKEKEQKFWNRYDTKKLFLLPLSLMQAKPKEMGEMRNWEVKVESYQRKSMISGKYIMPNTLILYGNIFIFLDFKCLFLSFVKFILPFCLIPSLTNSLKALKRLFFELLYL